MTHQHNSAEIHQRLEELKPKDIKVLVLQGGKTKTGNLEFTLKDISPQDPTLQAIISDPYFEVNSIGEKPMHGAIYYDLKTVDRQIRIRVACHKIEDNEEK